MTNLTEWVDALQADVEWQRIPVAMSYTDKRKQLSDLLVSGIESMYIATGRAPGYTRDWQIKDTAGILTGINDDLKIDELRYAFLSAKISFFQKVQTDVNNIVGYTTDALTVTNADKPYQNLAGTIDGLENERRKIYYSMVRHAYM